MNHTDPRDVDSPRSHWRLCKVLYDGGANDGKNPGWSAAEGQWDDDGYWRSVLALRWNGTEEKRLGNPQSSARPTWFIVPNELAASVREAIDRLGGTDR